MKRILSLLSFFCVLIAIGSFAMFQVGCDEAKGLNGLALVPASVTLSTNGQSVVITVTSSYTNGNLALPLVWSVSDPTLGNVTHSSGFSATYVRLNVNGVNTVIARDQYENEGYASIQQSAP
jgi:hypothetical protein